MPVERNDTLTGPKLLKREQFPMRLMNGCPYDGMHPEYSSFSQSSCMREQGSTPRNFRITCTKMSQPHDNFVVTGSCRERELCTGSPTHNHEAYCTLTPSFTLPISSVQSRHVRTILSPKILGRGEAIDVVFIDLDGYNDRFYFVEQMSLLPLDAIGNHLAMPITCYDCSSLTFRNAPANTHHYQLDTLMPRMYETAFVKGWVLLP